MKSEAAGWLSGGLHQLRWMMDIKQNAQRPHDFEAAADEALAAARNLRPGPERIEALKTAGKLRNAADVYGLIFAKRGRPAT